MSSKKAVEPIKTCADCIHEWACQAHEIGIIHNADATHCINYEKVRDSVAYFIGFREGKND